jgi:hypothetical protein
VREKAGLSNGIATAGMDFVATDGTLLLRAGERSRAFAIDVHSDGQEEEQEQIDLLLMGVKGYATLSSAHTSATMLIKDCSVDCVESIATSTPTSGVEQGQSSDTKVARLVATIAPIVAGLILLLGCAFCFVPVLRVRIQTRLLKKRIKQMQEHVELQGHQDGYTAHVLQVLQEGETAAARASVMTMEVKELPRPRGGGGVSTTQTMAGRQRPSSLGVKKVKQSGRQVGRAMGNIDRSVFHDPFRRAPLNGGTAGWGAEGQSAGECAVDPCEEVASIVTEQYPVIGGEDLDAIVDMAVRELRRLARQEQVRLGEKELELLTQGVLRQVLGCDYGADDSDYSDSDAESSDGDGTSSKRRHKANQSARSVPMSVSFAHSSASGRDGDTHEHHDEHDSMNRWEKHLSHAAANATRQRRRHEQEPTQQESRGVGVHMDKRPASQVETQRQPLPSVQQRGGHGPPTLMLPKPIAPLQRELGPGPAESTSEVVDSRPSVELAVTVLSTGGGHQSVHKNRARALLAKPSDSKGGLKKGHGIKIKGNRVLPAFDLDQ